MRQTPLLRVGRKVLARPWGVLPPAPSDPSLRFQNMRLDRFGQRARSRLKDLRWPLGAMAESQRRCKCCPSLACCPVPEKADGCSRDSLQLTYPKTALWNLSRGKSWVAFALSRSVQICTWSTDMKTEAPDETALTPTASPCCTTNAEESKNRMGWGQP